MMNGAGSRLHPSVSHINYSIAGCSDHSPRYNPENIKVDRTHDLSSRWSSNDNSLNSRSWVLLELESPSILESITFGKYEKVHPCNLKEFEVHIGMTRNHLKDVLRSQLQNDTKPETFPLPNMSNDGVQYPTRFVKIVCISAHGSKDGTNFNTSIWHIKLTGISDEQYIQRMTKVYEKRREDLSMRHILKHLRQRRHISVYRQLVTRTDVQLEHPLITSLYESLVLQGDWARTESILKDLASESLFSSYIQSCTSFAKWKRLRGTDANGDIPSRRGGHAMCMDVDNGLIYLFGGYDGRKSLDDFWVYNSREDRWRLISHSVAEEKNGPGPRACHKMVFDSKSGCIYMLGRLADEDFPSPPPPTETQTGNRNDSATNETAANPDVDSSGGTATLQPASTRTPRSGYLSEFYRYRTRGIDQGKWELLCVDTATVGGPKLVYDHQIVLDSDAQVIYVHGGRVVDGDWVNPKYSGLYSYDLRSGKWVMLQTNLASELIIPPRFGHSMTFDPIKKKLFIFAGQKDVYLSDMWEYDIPSRQATQLFDNITNNGGPEACFAHRAVIDHVLKEIYVFAGLEKTRSSRASPSSNVSLYRYDTRPGSWKRVPTTKDDPLVESAWSETQHLVAMENGTSAPVTEDVNEVPVARCAHQVVYDSRARIFYMHGGNGGSLRDDPDAETRLDDFWSMSLERPSPDEVIRKANFEVRKQQFREMCEESASIKALAFLQNDVSSVVNHNNATESSEFRSLLSHLLAAPAPPLATLDQYYVEEETRIPTPSSSGSSTEGRWTDGVLNADEDAVMVDGDTDGSGANTFIGREDSYEFALGREKMLTNERFEQRTKVFETLLTFVNSESKQPEGSLLDIVAGEL